MASSIAPVVFGVLSIGIFSDIIIYFFCICCHIFLLHELLVSFPVVFYHRLVNLVNLLCSNKLIVWIFPIFRRSWLWSWSHHF